MTASASPASSVRATCLPSRPRASSRPAETVIGSDQARPSARCISFTTPSESRRVMKPVSGLKAPTAIISRSERERTESASFGSERAFPASACASSPVATRSTSEPPWGGMRASSVKHCLLLSLRGRQAEATFDESLAEIATSKVASLRSQRQFFSLWAAGRQVAARLQRRQHLRQALRHRLPFRLDDDLRAQRLLVGVGDAGEVGDLASQRLLVEALDVATDELVDGALDVDLDEVANLGAHLVANAAVRRDGGGDDGDAVAAQQVGDEADAQDVGVAVLLAEAQTLAQVGAHHVPVQRLHLQAVAAQDGLQRVGDGGLAGAGEPREPDCETVLRHQIASSLRTLC